MTTKMEAAHQDVVFTKGEGGPLNLTAAAGLFASAAMMMHPNEEGEVSTHQHPDTSDNSHQPVLSVEGALGLGAVPRRRRGSLPDTATTERHSPDVDMHHAKRYVHCVFIHLFNTSPLWCYHSPRASDLSDVSMLTRVLRAACAAAPLPPALFSGIPQPDLCASTNNLADDLATPYVQRLVAALQQEQGGKCSVLRAVEEIIQEYRVLSPLQHGGSTFMQPYIMEADLSLPPPRRGSPASPSSHPVAPHWSPPLGANPLDSLAGLANQLLDEPRRGRRARAEEDYSPRGDGSEDVDDSDEEYALSRGGRRGSGGSAAKRTNGRGSINRAIKEQAAMHDDGPLPPGDWQSQPGVCRPDAKKRGSSRKRLRQIEVLLAMNLLKEVDVLHYKSKSGKIMATGTVKGNGIWCHRCSQIVGCTEFERCAGSGLRRPCDNIFTLDGTSLQELLQRADAMMLSGAKAMSSMQAAQAAPADAVPVNVQPVVESLVSTAQ